MKIPRPLHRLHQALLLAILPGAPASIGASPAPVPALAASWSAPAGDSAVLSVAVDLPEGWYVNSHAPLDSFLVPTRLEAEAPGLVFGTPVWPKPVVEHSDAMAGNMSLFKGDFEIRVTARPASASPGKRKPLPKPPPPAKVTLHYQSCDGKMCWPPKAVSAEVR